MNDRGSGVVGCLRASELNEAQTQSKIDTTTWIARKVILPAALWLVVAFPVAAVWATVVGDVSIKSREAILGRWQAEDGTVLEISNDAITTRHGQDETSQPYVVLDATDNNLTQGRLTIQITEAGFTEVSVTRSELDFTYPDGSNQVFRRLP